MIIFFSFVALLILQRIVELRIARQHEANVMVRGAAEIDRSGYRFIVAMHTAFFVSLVTERSIITIPLFNPYWKIFLIIFLGARVLRYQAIVSLGIYWNTKLIVTANHPIIRKGPYRFMRHPNYVAVVTELLVIPLMFSCYYTAVSFTIINGIVLRRRIRIESDALRNANGTEQKKVPGGITTKGFL